MNRYGSRKLTRNDRRAALVNWLVFARTIDVAPADLAKRHNLPLAEVWLALSEAQARRARHFG